eukprot:UN22655
MCPVNSTCRNYEGHYTCNCNPGFYANGAYCLDIDECLLNQHSCDKEKSECVNIEGSFECECLDGFIREGMYCEEDLIVDECSQGLANCHAHATCTDQKKGFRCDCLPGYIGDGVDCYNICMNIFSGQGIYGDNGLGEKVAPLGYGSDNREYEGLGHNMMVNFQDFPVPKAVQIRWPEEDMNTDAFIVKEGEEWEQCTGRHNCSSLGLEVTPNSPNPLYLILPGSTSGGLCINRRNDRSPYTFTCDGNNGQKPQVGMIDGQNKEMGCDCEWLGNCFVSNFEDEPVCMPLHSHADLWACFDKIDQCFTGLHDCDDNALCTTIEDSIEYECECKDGFIGDGFYCEDIDECALGTHTCAIHATCTNGGSNLYYDGKYDCTCHDGFLNLPEIRMFV